MLLNKDREINFQIKRVTQMLADKFEDVSHCQTKFRSELQGISGSNAMNMITFNTDEVDFSRLTFWPNLYNELPVDDNKMLTFEQAPIEFPKIAMPIIKTVEPKAQQLKIQELKVQKPENSDSESLSIKIEIPFVDPEDFSKTDEAEPGTPKFEENPTINTFSSQDKSPTQVDNECEKSSEERPRSQPLREDSICKTLTRAVKKYYNSLCFDNIHINAHSKDQVVEILEKIEVI
mmetsp:Transcript_13326/g.11816  ORF Transcript_13326/g.11816 Transcript_13326/m.11816 type:complete len:234 (-) Transcript_13326:427-1128(-)